MRQVYAHVPFNYLLEEKDSFIWRRADNLEIYLSADDLDSFSGNDYRDVGARLKEGKRAVTVHGPFMDIMPGSPDPLIREVAKRRFEQLMTASPPLNPRNIVTHIGYEPFKHEEIQDLWLEISLPLWRDVQKWAEEQELTIAFENVFEYDHVPIQTLLEALDSPCFRFCFDVGHFNIFSANPLEVWIKELGPYLTELHLHDNYGDEDEHSAIHEGNFDFDRLFTLLKEKNINPEHYVLEAHDQETYLKSFSAIKEYL